MIVYIFQNIASNTTYSSEIHLLSPSIAYVIRDYSNMICINMFTSTHYGLHIINSVNTKRSISN